VGGDKTSSKTFTTTERKKRGGEVLKKMEIPKFSTAIGGGERGGGERGRPGFPSRKKEKKKKGKKKKEGIFTYCKSRRRKRKGGGEKKGP